MQSFNIVGQVGILLQGLTDSLTNNCTLHAIAIARRALQALIEMCAGNFCNQYSAFKVQVVDTVMNILSISSVVLPNKEHLVSTQIFTTHYLIGISAISFHLTNSKLKSCT